MCAAFVFPVYIQQLLSALFVKDDEGDDEGTVENLSFTLRQLPDYLPCRCYIDGGRTQIVVRPLRRNEIVDFYAAVREAAASGNGYGFDELPGLAYFVRWYVDDMYNLVYELSTPKAENNPSSRVEVEPEKRVVIGYNNFGPSLYSRSEEKPALFDGNIVLRAEFRGRRWIDDLIEIRKGIGVDCGVRCFFEETYLSNMPAIRGLRRAGANICGTIPRNTYVRDVGFVDGVLFYEPLDESLSFSLTNRITQSKI